MVSRRLPTKRKSKLAIARDINNKEGHKPLVSSTSSRQIAEQIFLSAASDAPPGSQSPVHG
ncbi:hypothetical protein J6590_020628 [Homalodisca vitripennis]|nr:hypothetical protein J6590_020628 [Homalodisca vitripennis]